MRFVVVAFMYDGHCREVCNVYGPFDTREAADAFVKRRAEHAVPGGCSPGDVEELKEVRT